MQIDITKLVKKFGQAKGNEIPTQIVVCDYLKTKVMKPILSGKSVSISEIDFSRFSMDELEDLRSFLADLSDAERKLNGFCHSISIIKPRAISVPAFC